MAATLSKVLGTRGGPKREMLRLTSPLRVAVVGSGKAGRFHARALDGIDGASVACFVNRSAPAGTTIGGVPTYSDLDAALRHSRVDAAIVAVSWGSTASVAERLLSAKLPCLIEKPLGTTSEEAERLVRAAQGRTAFVGYNLRFQSAVLRALEVVEAFGSPTAVHIDAPEQSILAKLLSGARTEDVARRWLLLNTTHALDLFPLFFGGPVRVRAAAPPRYFQDVQCDYAALLDAAGGGTGFFSSHWRSPGTWTLQAIGTEYRLNIDLRSNMLEVVAPGLAVHHAASPRDTEFKPGVLLQDYYFLQSVISAGRAHPHLASLESGLDAIRLAESLMSTNA